MFVGARSLQKSIETDTIDDTLTECLTFLVMGFVNIASGICGIMGLLCDQICVQRIMFVFLILNVVLMLAVTLMEISYSACSGATETCSGFKLSQLFLNQTVGVSKVIFLKQLSHFFVARFQISLLVKFEISRANHKIFFPNNFTDIKKIIIFFYFLLKNQKNVLKIRVKTVLKKSFMLKNCLLRKFRVKKLYSVFLLDTLL